MSITIQSISDSDLEVADSILKAAFLRSDNWIPDLQLCRRLQPDGYFLACQNGTPVGMAGAVIYSNYAYIGLMAVHPVNQCQGVGFLLMEHLLSWLDRKGNLLVKLDASPAGQPLYEKLGFTACDEVLIFQRRDDHLVTSYSPKVHVLSPDDLDLLVASDIQAFGADRSRLLRMLLDIHPERAFLLQDDDGQVIGHLFAQRDRIGPWVMQEAASAELLLQAALSLSFDCPPVVVVPKQSEEAIALLQQNGFKLVRTNRHMARGAGAQAGERRKIFGQTSLFLG